MAKFGAIYLTFDDGSIDKVTTISDTLVKKGYLFIVRYFDQKPWIQLYVEEPENTAKYAQEISKIFPERHVIGLTAYTTSDSVAFCDYHNGEVARLLQSGFDHDHAWDKIEGEPQAWENEILAEKTVEVGSEGMATVDIERIGQWFDMPGFGVPNVGEDWTKEIFN